MIHITAEELRKLARAARLELPDNAQERLVNKLEAVLSYAQLLGNVSRPNVAQQSHTQPLLVRDDNSLPSIPNLLLPLAPQTEDHYFVVPVIIASPNK